MEPKYVFLPISHKMLNFEAWVIVLFPVYQNCRHSRNHSEKEHQMQHNKSISCIHAIVNTFTQFSTNQNTTTNYKNTIITISHSDHPFNTLPKCWKTKSQFLALVTQLGFNHVRRFMSGYIYRLFYFPS